MASNYTNICIGESIAFVCAGEFGEKLEKLFHGKNPDAVLARPGHLWGPCYESTLVIPTATTSSGSTQGSV